MSKVTLDECEALLERGFSIVPCTPDKKSLVGWKEYQEYAPSIDQIKEWLDVFPHMGIGVITGSVSGLIVVDLDVKTYKPNVNELMEAGLPVTRELLERTMISKTGGGGFHFLFNYSESDIRNSVGIISGSGWSVDIRGEGGYIVVPPSRHESGNLYSWVRDASLATLPMDLQHFLVERTQRVTHDKFIMPDIIPPGTKHAYLVGLAGKMMRSNNFTEDELYGALMTTLAIRQSPEDPDVVPNENVMNIARDVFARVKSGQWQGAEQKAEPVRKTYVPVKSAAVIKETAKPPASGVSTDTPGLDEIGGVAPGLYIIAAIPGAGKSTYMTQATMNFHDAGLNVVVISAEMPYSQWTGWMVSYIDKIPYDETFVMNEKWADVFNCPRMNIVDAESIDIISLKNMIIDMKPDVVILDNLTLVEFPEESTGQNEYYKFRKAAQELKAMTRDNPVSIHAIHHVKTDVDLTRNADVYALADSSGYGKSADVVSYLYPPRDSDPRNSTHDIMYECVKNRLFGMKSKTRLTFHTKHRYFTHSQHRTKP